MSTQTKPFLTPEQYLEIERNAEYKSEYLNGEMFAMAGGSGPHNQIGANILSDLHQQLRHLPCIVYTSDMQVQVSATGLYTYPDACVVCGDPRFLDEREQTLLNPTLIVEVLSPSTEAYHRGRKFEHYKTIEYDARPSQGRPPHSRLRPPLRRHRRLLDHRHLCGSCVPELERKETVARRMYRNPVH